MRPRILVAEDEPALARTIADNVVAEGWEVELVARGDEVADRIRAQAPGLLVLDLMLPGRPGLQVLRELRAGGSALPVLVLTARGEVTDRVLGLELGADDYMGKPFAMAELMARIRALLRRAQPTTAGAIARHLELGGVSFDFDALTSSDAQLTAHDVLVLRILAERRGQPVPRADIVEEACGLEKDTTLRTVDNHIVALRRALGDDPHRPRFIQSVRGIGYRLTEADGR